MKRTQMKISKRQNAIFMGLGIAALVAIFFYQVDYVRPFRVQKWVRLRGLGH